MNNSILNIEVQVFINENLNSDITSILLKGTAFPNIETKEIIKQIESKKKCEKKLPTWFNAQHIYYPNKLNIEQTSSELTANYKSKLISGDSIIDLTGGFGVDCYYFSKHFKDVFHCEIDKNLSELVDHNFNKLNATSIKTLIRDGVQFLKENNKTYDWIYVDPSRRHESKGKVFFLKDCLPNIPDSIDLLFKRSRHIMIKTSPLLDISLGINELKFVKEIHVVAVENEVKELLWILENNYIDDIKVTTVNIKKTGNEIFVFNLNEETDVELKFCEPLTYLYEPNAAILKSGAFKLVSVQLNMFKLNVNTHLYTLDRLIDFPGRCFKIEAILPYSKHILKTGLPHKANITIRNFPEPVAQIRKKYKILEGGNNYLFFTTNLNEERIVLICSKIES